MTEASHLEGLSGELLDKVLHLVEESEWELPFRRHHSNPLLPCRGVSKALQRAVDSAISTFDCDTRRLEAKIAIAERLSDATSATPTAPGVATSAFSAALLDATSAPGEAPLDAPSAPRALLPTLARLLRRWPHLARLRLHSHLPPDSGLDAVVAGACPALQELLLTNTLPPPQGYDADVDADVEADVDADVASRLRLEHLTSLHKLRLLSLSSIPAGGEVSTSWIARLSALTDLNIDAWVPGAQLELPPSLKRLSLKCKFVDNGERPLSLDPSLKDLVNLSLERVHVQPVFPSSLTRLRLVHVTTTSALQSSQVPGLLDLELARLDPAPHTVEFLAACLKLTSLRLRRNFHLNDPVQHLDLGHMRGLRVLEMVYDSFCPLPSLDTLRLSSVYAASLRSVTALQSLHTLELRSVFAPMQLHIAVLAGLTSLTSLRIGYATLTDCSPLLSLSGLRSLSLSHLGGVMHLPDLSALGRLTQLRFHLYQLTEVPSFAPLVSLQDCSLHLVKCKPAADLSVLPSLTSLECLGALSLKGCTRLKHLKLNFRGLPDEDQDLLLLSHISQLTSLLDVSIFRGSMTSLEGLGQLPLLTNLTVKECKNLQRLKLAPLPRLDMLSVWHCPRLAFVHALEDVPPLAQVSINGVLVTRRV